MSNVIKFPIKKTPKKTAEEEHLKRVDRQAIYLKLKDIVDEVDTLMVIGVKADHQTVYFDYTDMTIEDLGVIEEIVMDMYESATLEGEQ